jgi:transglutaminase-like putative cysteine protease
MPAHDMAAYMRERRARLKAEAERAVALGYTSKPKGAEAKAALRRAEREAKAATLTPRPAVPLGRELTRAEKRHDAQLEAIEARGGTAQWTGDRWQEAPKRTPAPAAPARPPTPPADIPGSFLATGSPNRELTVTRAPLHGEVISPPRSMIADGGTPPRRYGEDASVAEATALIRAYAAEQARINAETARRLAALERHVMIEERNKASKAAGMAKWAEAQRLFFNMLRPQPL